MVPAAHRDPAPCNTELHERPLPRLTLPSRATRGLILQPDFVICDAGVLDVERPPLDDHGL